MNQQTPEKCIVVPKSENLIYWDGSNYPGGSVCAFYCLAKINDYSTVYCETAGVNCFCIRKDLIENNLSLKKLQYKNFLIHIFYLKTSFCVPKY